MSLRYLDENEYSFAQSFISGLENPGALRTLLIDSCGAAFTEPSVLPWHLDPMSSFYNIEYPRPCLRLGHSFRSLSSIHLHGWDEYPTEGFDLLSVPAATSVVVLEDTGPLSNPFPADAYCYLQSLILTQVAIDRTMMWDVVHFPHLHSLSLLQRPIHKILSLLSRIYVPQIETLHLQISLDEETVEGSDLEDFSETPILTAPSNRK